MGTGHRGRREQAEEFGVYPEGTGEACKVVVDCRNGDRLSLLVRRWGLFLPVTSGLGHTTCFGEWDIGKGDTSRGLSSTRVLGLALMLFSESSKKQA